MKRMKRALALLLVLAMLISTIPTQALAYASDKGEAVTITDKNGSAVTEDASWEEAFPYGTFAFGNSQLTVEEGGEGVIQLYRLGGTNGRAIAYVSYVPPAVKMADGSVSHANAAGAEDVEIRVEDPLPIAEYQPLGKDPEPLEAETPAKVVQTPYEGEDAQEGDTALALDQPAEAWQWQARSDGGWREIDGGCESQLVVSEEDAEAYDFRCIYTVEGGRFGSASLQGEEYVRLEEEALPDMPEDLEQNPEPTYSELPMDGEAPYDGHLFSVVFADGEWVKELHVSAPEDDMAEPDKFGLFTIEDCLGGSLYDTANTLTLHVADNDEAGESFLGFAQTSLDADKAGGSAALTVRRTGDTTQVLTVEYRSEDGSAESGTDYTAVSGSLIFYAGVTEQTIEIPLIDDGEAADARLDFSVVLSGVKGGSGRCTLTADQARVSLWNSGTGEGKNLATLLADGEARDISGSVEIAGETVAQVDPGAVTGSQVTEEEQELLEAEIISEGGSQGDIAPMTYDYPSQTLSFKREDHRDYNSSYWVDKVCVAETGDLPSGSYINAVGSGGIFGDWSGGNVPGGGKLWAREFWCKKNGSISVPVKDEFFEEKFSQLYLGFDFSPEWANEWVNLFCGNNEWTYPWFRLHYNNTSQYFDSGAHQDGNNIYYFSPRGNTFSCWTMTDDVKSLQLGTSENDAHASEKSALSRINYGELSRRSLYHDLGLRIYTANDADTHGDAALISTELYGNNGGMQPTVSLEPEQGGVTGNGKLYVGSRLKVELKTLDSYYPGASGVDHTVFITDSQGRVKAWAVKDSEKAYHVDMVWDNIDLNDTYTVNVIMTRKQEVGLDITPSVTRREDDPTVIDAGKIGESWKRFWDSAADSGKNQISYGVASRSNTAPYLDSRRIAASAITSCGQNSAQVSLGKLENLQWINFGRSAEDYIVFNGRIYAGNETIWLEQKDLGRGKLSFSYYNKDFISSTNTMNVKLNGAGLYLDKNCNGRIDGWWNEELGIFELDKDAENGGDEFLFRLEEDTDYDEIIFAPVEVEWDDHGNPTKYAQYFLKAEYSLTPRSLIPGPGVDVNQEKAQVLPAFVTGLTDTGSYSELTTEQQSYRYIISGMSRIKSESGLSEYSRSGDDRPMYGAAATETAVIDIPLGGDTSPAELNADGSAYTWEPSYHGNLLYPFENPEPIFIENSVAGENIPVAQIRSYENGRVIYENGSDGRSGVDLLNGYLGSLNANDTYALCVQEQKMTTDEIAKANGVTIHQEAGNGGLAMQSAGMAERPVPESAGIGGNKAMPNSGYLQQSSAGDDNEGSFDMDDSGSEFPEFNLDLGVQLPNSRIAVTDFASIIMDGDQVGFSIGLPLGGYDSRKKKQPPEKPGEKPTGGMSPAQAISRSGQQMAKMLDWMKDPSGNIHGENTADKTYANATAKDTGKELTSSSFTVNFYMSAAFLFKYNSVDNAYYFSQFSASLSASLKLMAQYRFSACPVVYLYLAVNISADIGTGATIKREVILGGEQLVSTEDGSLKKGESLVFETDKKAFQLQFEGKVLVQAFTDQNCTQKYTGKGVQAGYLQSDGGDPVTVTLVRKDGQELGEKVYVRLTAMKDTAVSSFKQVTGAETKTYYSGFTFSPKIYVEAGAGIGIAILKFEIFLKVNVGCSMVFSKESSSGTKSFEFDKLQFGLGVGFRVVLMVFSYSMDLIQYNVTLKDGSWKQSWSALGGLYGGETNALSATDSQGNTYGVHVALPGSAADTQAIYTPERENVGGVAPNSIDPPNGKDVPFQLSGYGSSADAFRLTDGLIAGYDYKTVAAKGKNYLIYTISRTGASNPVDNSMLVMSELRLTSVEGQDSYGLVNPVDGGDSPPYVLLDTIDGSTDDGTGDLEFTAWTDQAGTIHGAWVSYAQPAAAGGGGSVSDAIDDASKNTVVKSASFTPGTSTGFSVPTILSGMNGGAPVTGAHVFLPGVVDSGTAVFGRAEHYTGTEVDALKADYKAYLKGVGADPDSADEGEAQIGQYRLSYQEGLWDVYGGGSELCASVDGSVSAVPLAEGQTLDNLEAVQIGDAYYAAYTTTQRQYMKDGVSTASGSGADDLLTIRRLFLRTFTAAEDGTVSWAEKPLLLRTLYDYDENAGGGKDGVYIGGRIEEYDDPYFANLQFLNADLGDLSGKPENFTAANSQSAEDFLLFEMNGSTYVIPQKDLESIAGEGKGSIIPFFTPASIGEKQQSSTGRTEAVIGADGAGGLAAVYVGTAAASSSNAVYLTRYDPKSATWGAGTMLAMSHMQVYEDAAAYGLTSDQAEKAFLGKETGNKEYDAYISGMTDEEKAHSQGTMDFLTFSNLQIALGQKKTQSEAASSSAASDDGMRVSTRPSQDSALRNGEDQPELTAEGTGDKDTLLIITQGTMRYLREIDNNGETVIGPMSDTDAQSKFAGGGIPDSRKPGVGVYAISYGAGQQAAGEASLSLASYDFSAGTALAAGLTFKNTGDAALRAGENENERLTVKLMVSDTANTTELASWKITDHVLAGQQVSLSAECALLTADLKKGSTFYFTVEEGGYFTDAFSFQSEPLFTVGDMAELGFESLDVTTKSVDKNGKATLDVELDVSNRGSKAAKDVYLQFSYEGADGGYLPLDLTGNTLETAKAEKLSEPAVMAVSDSTDLQNGIFRLVGKDGGDIEAGYHRQVAGAITVPAACYADSLTGGLSLRVEIFSAGDTVTAVDAGVLEAEHGEYYAANNAQTVSVGHATFFSGASRVSLAMGNTMRLPITLSTTTGRSPSIAVVETPKQGEGSHLGVLYYQNGSFSGGRETGTLVMAPTGMGSGIVHLQDLNTNTVYAVAYTVTNEGSGINIFNDTDVFAFQDYDPEAVGDGLPWKFSGGVLSWGEGSGNTEAPMNHDLAWGKVEKSFSFETQAESMKLYFDGEVTVSSTFPGFNAGSYKAEGGKNGFAEIKFGRNDTNYAHTVTVTVKKGAGQNDNYARFDRVILTYGAGGTPVPAEDGDAPRVYWSRSFPDTASVATGGSVSLRAFILDSGGLASVTVNGQNAENTEKTDGRFWTVPLTLTKNGILELTALDTSGHRTTRKVEVDWFLDTPVPGASAEVPELTEVKFAEKEANKTYEIICQASPSVSAGGAQPSLGITAITSGEDGLIETDHSSTPEVSANGWYYVKATDSAEGCTGQWSAQMLYMGQIDTKLPTVTIGRAAAGRDEGGGADLEWHVRKETSVSTTVATISKVALNGKELDIRQKQTWVAGTWHAAHAGAYEVTAEDTAGNAGRGFLDLTDIPVYVESGKSLYTVQNADNEDDSNGSITVDSSVLLGGRYDAAKSDPAAGNYAGSYEWRLVRDGSGTELTALLSEDGSWTSTRTAFEGLVPGGYTLYVRDANDKRNEKTVLSLSIAVGSELIDVTLEEEVETLGGSASSSDGLQSSTWNTSQSRLLAWSARKREGALNAITSVTVNGQTVEEQRAFSLSGEFAIHFGGEYRLTAADGRGVTAGAVVTAKDFPITARNNSALATISHPWNAGADNGSVTVNLTDESGGALVTGGLYDAALSDPANGSYAGSYEWRLEPAFTFDAEARLEKLKQQWLEEHSDVTEIPAEVLAELESRANDEEGAKREWLSDLLASEAGWMALAPGTNRLDDQKAGNYTLLIRDAQDKTNLKTVFALPVVLNDEHISLEAETSPARGGNNGSVTAKADKGYQNLNTYQFILRPIKKKEDAVTNLRKLADPLDRDAFPESLYKQPEWDIPDFTQLDDPEKIADTSYDLLNSTAFGELPPGWYQVAARPMLGVSSAELLELAKLAACGDERYEAKYEELMSRAAAAYEDPDQGTIGWGNADTVTVHVIPASVGPDPTPGQIETGDLEYPDGSTVTVSFNSEKTTLSDEAEVCLIFDNASRDIVAVSSVMKAVIPAGTLSVGDSIMPMLMPFTELPGDTTGMVVRYTDRSGAARYVPWSVVAGGRVRYIAAHPGNYEIITNRVEFSDVSQKFWGAESIGFVAARELFQGVGNKRFDPSGTMTRGMVVAVLARLEGIDDADYTGRAFTDVSPSAWYGPAVAWAAENGIAAGVGEDRFEPETPVTREQLCAMLARYLDYAEIDLRELSDPSAFRDQEQISDWAESDVERFRKAGIVHGTDTGDFLPRKSASRAEVAVVFTGLITATLAE